jgi:hypothetical protein
MNILQNIKGILAGITAFGNSALNPVDPYIIKVIDAQSPNPQRPDLIETTVNSLEAAKAAAVWLTKGSTGNQPATAVLLKDCTSDHLKNILINKPNLSMDYYCVIEALLKDRGEALPLPGSPLVPSSAPIDNLNNIL